MDARAALLDLVLAVDPLVRRQRTRLQRRARASQRRALAVLAPDRAPVPPAPAGPPDAEALVRMYYAAGGTHEDLVAAISRARGLSPDDLADW